MAVSSSEGLLGRYRSRYREFEEPPGLSRPTGTIEVNNKSLLDLANAKFGKARVCCWTCPKGRRWGMHGQEELVPGQASDRFECEASPAVVMHFRMQATGPEYCRLSEFSLDLNFSAIAESQNTSQQLSATVASAGEQPGVCLIDMPAPSRVRGEPKIYDETLYRPWEFRSISIADEENGLATTARWIWRPHYNDPQAQDRVLHGGIGLQHTGHPFAVTCRVAGKVSKPGGFKLKFKNLDDRVGKLEGQMIQLNEEAAAFPHVPTSCMNAPLDHIAVRGCSYGESMITGAARVHMGNAYYNCDHSFRDAKV